MLNLILPEKLFTFGRQKIDTENTEQANDYNPDVYRKELSNFHSDLLGSNRGLFNSMDFNEHYDQT